MKKRTIQSKVIGGSYSNTTVHATEAGGFVFLTGQVANRPGSAPASDPTELVELGTIEEQTVQVMENIKSILEEAGTSFDNVLKRNVFITQLGDFAPVYGVMERYFPSQVASTGIITGLVPPSARVEVDVVAVIPD